MKVELLVTLKGKDIWEKGLILDSEQAPIPSDILEEIRLETGTVRVIKEKPADDQEVVEEPVVVDEEEPIPEKSEPETIVVEQAEIVEEAVVEPEQAEPEETISVPVEQQSPSIFQVEPDHHPAEADVSEPAEGVVPEKATAGTTTTTAEKCTICGKIFSSEEYPDPKRSLRGHQARAHHKKSRRK